MPCPTPEMHIQNFAATVFVVKRQTEGLTHPESLIQPPFRGNCLNWVLGHIIKGRNEALQRLGLEPIWDEATRAIYQTGSDPLTSTSRVIALEQLLTDLDETQSLLETALKTLPAEKLDENIQVGERLTTVGDRLEGLHWHETYHVGQLELLRQLTGKDDKIF